tara:strand:+ start:473 stop:1045 length:573 start_codon:yes stop_codon:yes gene_type:complete
LPIPALFKAGDTIRWRDNEGYVNWLNETVSNADYTAKAYLRFNKASEGLTITGSDYGQGWEFTVSASDSATMDAGTWYFTIVATKSDDTVTLYEGKFEVEASLTYSGTPGAFDGRSQAKKDLDAVTDAIRSLISGKAKEYSIGNRSFKYQDLSELRMRESQLKAEVVREDKANMIANGLGNPHNLKVRFW